MEQAAVSCVGDAGQSGRPGAGRTALRGQQMHERYALCSAHCRGARGVVSRLAPCQFQRLCQVPLQGVPLGHTENSAEAGNATDELAPQEKHRQCRFLGFTVLHMTHSVDLRALLCFLL